jgi:hypothetical protein
MGDSGRGRGLVDLEGVGVLQGAVRSLEAEEDRVAEVALSVDLRRSLSLIKRLSISHVSRV